jgi:hypothetical protein
MGSYKKKSGHLEFHYGYDDEVGEYWYTVIDTTRLHINEGILEEQGTKLNNMPPLVMAEKMKQFGAPVDHIQKVLWMKKI